MARASSGNELRPDAHLKYSSTHDDAHDNDNDDVDDDDDDGDSDGNGDMIRF